MSPPSPKPTPESIRERLSKLGWWGALAHEEEFLHQEWLPHLLDVEEAERKRRSLERRLHHARLGSFKMMAEFDYGWPKKLDRELLEELFSFTCLEEPANVILLGPNGVGKTMIAKNLAHQALLRGYTVRFTTASDMLHDLAAQDSDASLARRLHRYCQPQLLAVDEVGYLSYDTRYADLFFEVVTRRYQQRSIVLTTNKPFGEWNQVFPNAACVVTLVDRLVHRAEIISIEGSSYRLKEAQERTATRAKTRAAHRSARKKS